MLKVKGILFAELKDQHDEIILVEGANINKLREAAITSANGNLLGRVTSAQVVFRAITDDSVELAVKADLIKELPQFKDENALTGADYAELKHPFVKITGTLIDNSNLKQAIKNGNLYFGFEGSIINRVGNLISECKIKNVTIGLTPTQKCSKIYLDE